MLTIALLIADPTTSQTDILTLLTGISGPAALALIAAGFWTERLVPGGRYKAAVKERDELQAALMDKVIPAITEANVTMRELGKLVQRDVSLRDPRRSE